jgi:hypothetical protein
MTPDSVFETSKGEHHSWATCPCWECVAERRRLVSSSFLPSTPFRSISPSLAYLLGLIQRRSPNGSLARDIASRA